MNSTLSVYIEDLYVILSHPRYSIIDSLKPHSTFVLDVSPEKISNIFLETGSEFIGVVRNALFRILTDKYGSEANIKTRFRHLSIELTGVKSIPMHEISSREHESKTLTFDCIVVASDSPKTYVVRGIARCKVCGNEEECIADINREILIPRCDNPSCKLMKMKLDPDRIETNDIQTILLQEPMESSKQHSPSMLTGKIIGTNVGTVFVGQSKRVTGIFRSLVDEKTNENEIIIDIASLEDLEAVELLKPDDNTLKKLKNHAEKHPDEYKKSIISSFAPHIFGYKEIKESLLLTLLSGSLSSDKRGDIHMLMVGDPSMAKSELLKSAKKITQRSIYTSGKGATAAGLTIGMVKLSNGTQVAQAGVLPLCNGGFALIDEFDKMGREDRSSMHEAMEQQTVSIAKAGTKMTLPAKTTILAAANPKYGKYDQTQTLGDNLEVPSPLISRFDIIWLFLDKIHRDDDREKAKHVINSFKKTNSKEYETYLTSLELTSVLNYARELEPVLNDDTVESMLKLYEKLRDLCRDEEKAKLPVGVRQLEAIVRMSTAHAKLMLRSVILPEDVKAVEKILSDSLQSFGLDLTSGEFNQTFLEGIRTKDTKERIVLSVWYKVADEDGNVRSEKFLKELSVAPKFDENSASRYFAQWETQNTIKMNRDGTWRRT
tara:strand:+ start:140 stop:2122 length:1983 start_codon:yes stop_codon:yes gene_type:complete